MRIYEPIQRLPLTKKARPVAELNVVNVERALNVVHDGRIGAGAGQRLQLRNLTVGESRIARFAPAKIPTSKFGELPLSSWARLVSQPPTSWWLPLL